MKRYLYNYQVIITFGAPVTNHSVLLRCMPMNAGYQTVEEEHLIFSPDFWTMRGNDAFGNRVIYGGQREAHASYAYVSAGIVAMEPYAVKEPLRPSPVYLLPTPLTTLPSGERLCGLSDAMEICAKVYDMLEYSPCVTTVDTPVTDVLRTGKGVCQDYAHLMIAMLRQSGVAARYVCGLLEGTGATHAWVEVYDGYGWQGYDPTNNTRITYGYIKLAHGRDAADCSVSRGLYSGATTQEQLVSVTVKEI